MSGFLDRVLTRLVNPGVRLLARTPWHDLVSGRIVILTFAGRSSGRTISVPVCYVQDGERLTVASGSRRLWWRNLEGGARVRVLLRGIERDGWAGVDVDSGRVVVTVRLGAAIGTRASGGVWRRWFAAVTLGEILGFSVPALVATAVTDSGEVGFGQAAAIVAAGLIEGGVLGLAQAYALRVILPGVGTVAWTAATASGAGVAWMIGVIPMVLGERLLTWHPGLLVALGLSLLTAMGGLQWPVLRRHVRRAVWWIPATALSWMIALGVFTAITSPLWQEGQPGWLVAAIGLLGGAAMAATVAALTGLALVRLAGRKAIPHEPRPRSRTRHG